MRRTAWALLLVFVFTIPWEYSLDLGAPLGNISRICGLTLLLAIIPAVLLSGRIRVPGVIQWLTLALFLWFCCSYFWSIDPSSTLQRLRSDAQVMMVVWIIWELVESADQLRDLVRVYVAGSWVLGLLTIASLAWPGSEDLLRFAPVGQDPNDVARFLDLGFPFAALLVNGEPRRWGRTLAFGYFPMGMVAVSLTGSRSGALAALLAILGCGFLLQRCHPRLVASAAMLLPLIAAVFWYLVPRAPLARIASIPEQLAGGDLNQRLNIWAAGWQAFAHAPWLGSGAGSFVDAAGLAQVDTAHNTVVSVAVEGGLVALTLTLALAVAGIGCVQSMRGAARIGFGTVLLVLLVASMAATVEGNRSAWFLFAMVSVTKRITREDSVSMMSQFEPVTFPRNRSITVGTLA